MYVCTHKEHTARFMKVCDDFHVEGRQTQSVQRADNCMALFLCTHAHKRAWGKGQWGVSVRSMSRQRITANELVCRGWVEIEVDDCILEGRLCFAQNDMLHVCVCASVASLANWSHGRQVSRDAVDLKK